MDEEFTATIVKETKKSGWTSVLQPGSTTCLATEKALGVEGTIDGNTFKASLLPFGSSSQTVLGRSFLNPVFYCGKQNQLIDITDLLEFDAITCHRRFAQLRTIRLRQIMSVA